MKKWQSILFQIAASAGQIFNYWSPVIPDKYKIYIGLGIGSAQVVAGNMASNSNPDGTPAEKPYEKK
jgi:hypothetical protein